MKPPHILVLNIWFHETRYEIIEPVLFLYQKPPLIKVLHEALIKYEENFKDRLHDTPKFLDMFMSWNKNRCYNCDFRSDVACTNNKSRYYKKEVDLNGYCSVFSDRRNISFQFGAVQRGLFNRNMNWEVGLMRL